MQRKIRDPSEGYLESCQEIQDSALPEPQTEQRADPMAYVEVPVQIHVTGESRANPWSASDSSFK